MKKFTAYILLIMMVITTITPAFADLGYSINVTLSQDEYLLGDALSFSGVVMNGLIGADSMVVAAKVENNLTGEKVYIDQFTTTETGNFSGGFLISEKTTPGTYLLTLSTSSATSTTLFTVQTPIPAITLTLSGLSFRPNENLSITGQVLLKNVPQINVDVTLQIISVDTGSVFVTLDPVKTNTEGKYFSNYRIPPSAVNKQFLVRATALGQVVASGYAVNPIIVPPVVPEPPVVPVVPTTTEEVVILNEEGIPLGAASEIASKNSAGDKVVEVILDPDELDTAIDDDSSDKIIVTITETDISELYVVIPSEQLIRAGKAKKILEFVSDDIEFTLDANCLSVVTGFDVVVAFKKQNPDGLYTLSKSLDMNQVSDQYDFSVYYKLSLKAIKILKPVVVGLQFAPTLVESAQRLGMYDFDAAKSKYYYVGGRSLNEFSILYAGVKEAGVLSIMEYNMQFADLPNSHWSYNQINVLVSKHIVNGVGNGIFKGERQIKRSEFIAMLVNAAALTEGTTPVALTDISDAWYTSFVEIAASNGIIPATGAFRPNDIMTRAEMASALANVIKLTEDTTQVSLDVLSVYGDKAQLDSSLMMDIAIVTEFKLFNGINGNFAPAGLATRAQAAVVIYELLVQLGLL